MNKSLVKTFYAWGAGQRDLFFASVVKILTRLKITPNMVSLSGVFLMFGFILIIQKSLVWAFIFLLANILIDILDGPLARYQQKNSVRGKFFDLGCDNLNYALFVFGLIYFGIVNWIAAFVYLALIFSYILIMIFEEWKINQINFQKSGGFLAVSSFFKLISYILFLLFILAGLNYLNVFFELSSFILAISAIIKLFSIRQKK